MCRAQSCLTLCDPMDCSPPGSSVHGVSQARVLEWVAISSYRGSSWPRDQTHVSCVSCIGGWLLYHWATWETQCESHINNVYDLMTIVVRCSNYCLLWPCLVQHLGHTYVSKSKPILFAVWQASKSRDELMRAGNHDFIGRLADCADGGLVSQRTILPKLELGLILF